MTAIELQKLGSGRFTEADRSEFAHRLARVRQLTEEEGYDALLAADGGQTTPPGGHTRYLTNWAVPGHVGANVFAAVVVPLVGEPTLVVPPGPLNCFPAVARQRSPLVRVHSTPWDGWPPQSDIAQAVLETLAASGLENARIGVCGGFPGFDGVKEQLPRTEFVAAVRTNRRGKQRDLVEQMRAVKSQWEVERIRTAQTIAESALQAFFSCVRPGESYGRATAEATYVARCLGAESTITIFSAGQDPWCWWYEGGPDREFVSGDLVAIEFNPCVDGYLAQLARSAVVGPAQADQQHVMDTAVHSLHAMREALRPGVTGGELWDIGVGVVRQAGLEPWGRFGHGIGLGMAESVDVADGDDDVVEEGHCFELHAGVIDRRRMQSCLMGDQFIVTATGIEEVSSSRMPYAIPLGGT